MSSRVQRVPYVLVGVQAMALLAQTHELIAFLVQAHGPEVLLAKMLKGKGDELVGIYIRTQKVPYVWVWISFSKQNAPINEVPIVRGPPLGWDKMQVWIESVCFYVFLAMLAGRGSREGG